MYPVGRLAYVWWRARAAARLPADAVVATPLVALPSDLDFNLHVNNGRYLTLMDLGRYDLILRTGLWTPMREKGWFPVLSSASIRFRKSLKAFQRFTLTTQIIYWDEKWFYIEHRIARGDDLYTRALVKGLFRGPGGAKVPTAEVLAAGGGATPPVPPMPDLVRGWNAAEPHFL